MSERPASPAVLLLDDDAMAVVERIMIRLLLTKENGTHDSWSFSLPVFVITFVPTVLVNPPPALLPSSLSKQGRRRRSSITIMARKKLKKDPSQQNGGGNTNMNTAATINNRGDDAILEKATKRAAAEKKRVDDDSCNSIMSCSSILSHEVIILLSNDVLGSISSFLASKDLFNLSLTCKKMTGAIEEVALQMISAAQVRYGGEEEDISELKKMHLLLRSPIEFTDLLGENLGYLRGDKACVYSSNPNRLHTPYYIDAKVYAAWWQLEWVGRNVLYGYLL